MNDAMLEATTIWTIGHSTRPLATFLELLAPNRIESVHTVVHSCTSAARIVQGRLSYASTQGAG